MGASLVERSPASAEVQFPRGPRFVRIAGVEPVRFDGEYEDPNGVETITWLAEIAEGPGVPRFELRTSIRGLEFSGFDFDGLEAVDHEVAIASGFSLQPSGDLFECVLRGALPLTVAVGPELMPAALDFALDLRREATRNRSAPMNLTLSTTIGDATYRVVDDWFEDGLEKLIAQLEDGERLVCCFTCLYSDYSPLGHGLLGMRCHRDAKEQYLAVRSKVDYWPVPVAEDVMESYLCPEYDIRVPGTGYRG